MAFFCSGLAKAYYFVFEKSISNLDRVGSRRKPGRKEKVPVVQYVL